ncbi:MAG: hypothetical protein D6740_05985 [Alphaproteobacteria bacterium]|nr:MAG: hypothetical protein D6740_05985 [Alphaproteobacteria bacterium]
MTGTIFRPALPWHPADLARSWWRLAVAAGIGVAALMFLAAPSLAARHDRTPGHDPSATPVNLLKPPPGVVITVTFSNKLARRIGAIDRIEQIMEERWRRHRITTASVRASITDRQHYGERKVSVYGGEKLIPDLDAYTAANIIKAATVYNLRRALPDFRGRIAYEIRKLKVARHPVAFLNGSHSYVVGRVRIETNAGKVLLERKIHAQLIADLSPVYHYDGPRLPFIPSDADRRIAPVLTAFVERALKAAFPDRKDEIMGPIFAPFTAPENNEIAP